MRFPKKPTPVHPNCTCEVRRVEQRAQQRKLVALGTLHGFEDNAFEQFQAGQKISIEIRNLGPLPAAVRMLVDQREWRATSYLRIGGTQSFDFSKFGDTPMTWEVYLANLGGEGASTMYFIYG